MGAVHQDLEEKERMWVIRLSQGLSAGVCILKIRARAEKHEAGVGFAYVLGSSEKSFGGFVRGACGVWSFN